jgi:hypothetical protein
MGQQWAPPPDGGYTAGEGAEAREPGTPPPGGGGVEPPLSERYRVVCEMLRLELDRPVVPDNWRAQFAVVLQTREYLRAVGVIEAWPGVAPGRLEEPLIGAERDAIYAAANRGARLGDAACRHGFYHQAMRCPLCESEERRSAEPHEYAMPQHAALETRLREVTAERDRLRRDLEDEVAAREGAEEWATRIAEAFVPAEVLGEWSNSNSPWVNAVEYAERARTPRLEGVLDELEQLRDRLLERASRRFEDHESGSVEEGESVDCDGPGCTDAADCHAVAAVTTWTRAADVVQARIAELRTSRETQESERP